MAILGLILIALAVVLVWAGYSGRNPWTAMRAFLGGDPTAFSSQA